MDKYCRDACPLIAVYLKERPVILAMIIMAIKPPNHIAQVKLFGAPHPPTPSDVRTFFYEFVRLI